MKTTMELLTAAKAVTAILSQSSEAQRNQALGLMADNLIRQGEQILMANREDLRQATGIRDVMLDRLQLDPLRIMAMAKGIRDVISLPDPLGRVLRSETLANGLHLKKITVPFGVVAIIFESRPNVAADAAALTLKSGNVCILRCGKEARNSCQAIVQALQMGLTQAGLPETCIQLVEEAGHGSVTTLMEAKGYVDLLIPRGGAGLIQRVTQGARVPVIETGIGICHIYVEAHADLEMALAIVDNAKTSRPSVCNAAEVCLVDQAIAPWFLRMLKERLVDERLARGEQPVELRLDQRAQTMISGTPATDKDFDTEFLDYILAIQVVDGVSEAIQHINIHGTGHSEAIVTSDKQAAEAFVRGVDAAAVYVNASTRFTDGGEFGLGCEIGISTQKLHARGPMGLAELTTYKTILCGEGQIR